MMVKESVLLTLATHWKTAANGMWVWKPLPSMWQDFVCPFSFCFTAAYHHRQDKLLGLASLSVCDSMPNLPSIGLLIEKYGTHARCVCVFLCHASLAIECSDRKRKEYKTLEVTLHLRFCVVRRCPSYFLENLNIFSGKQSWVIDCQ